ncbi:MAG: hypothetical protein HYU36_15150 [Planctomycetes bacterium]|nr:hypothetical protein [Planctomycetota bacterium]
MPLRELRYPWQVQDWLEEWGRRMEAPAEMVLIGSGALLWHAGELGINEPLPENSMDVDTVTDDEAVALLAYDATIGSEFERHHGWHVNLMPEAVLGELPAGWESRASRKAYGPLAVLVPSPPDLLAPKVRRGEPRDIQHAEWARRVGLLPREKS